MTYSTHRHRRRFPDLGGTDDFPRDRSHPIGGGVLSLLCLSEYTDRGMDAVWQLGHTAKGRDGWKCTKLALSSATIKDPTRNKYKIITNLLSLYTNPDKDEA